MANSNLACLLPESLAQPWPDEAPPGWQSRKSLATRNAVLEAALACLAEGGYAGCSLQSVATRAGISRGAMLHHYTSKLELMAAVVEYAFYRRMAAFIARIRALSETDRADRSEGVNVFFGICQTPEYRAYLELHIAARTDADLRACFLGRARRYDQLWRDEVKAVFPEWSGDERLALLNDYVCSVVEGLALNADIWNDISRTDAVLRYTAATIQAVRTGQFQPPPG